MKIRENNQEIQHTYVLIIDCSLILKSFQLIPEPFPFYYHLMRNFLLKISKGTKLQKQIDPVAAPRIFSRMFITKFEYNITKKKKFIIHESYGIKEFDLLL
jgi:hypothetical protein